MTTRTLEALPAQQRRAPIAAVDAAQRTIEVTWTTGATVRRRRYGWGTAVPYDEQLVVTREAVDLERMNAGAPVVDSHNTYSTRAQVAVVDRAWIEGGEGRAVLRFPSAGVDEAADRMWGMVADKIIRNISVGYQVNEVEVTEAERKGEVEQWRVTRWTPFELSFVTVPADPKAQTRAAETETYPVTISRARAAQNPESTMHPENPAAPDPAAATRTDPTPAPPSPPAPQPPAALPDIAGERARSAAIMDIGTRAGFDAAAIRAAIEDGSTVDAFRVRAFDRMAGQADRSRTSTAQVGQDETETRRAAMQEVLAYRLGPQVANRPEPSAAARQYMDYSIVDLAATRLGERRVPSSFAGREAVLERAFHSASDFPILFGGAINQALAGRYAQAQPTYRRLARQRTYTDFRDHIAIRTGDFPDLQPVNPDGGEIKGGTFGAKQEKTAVKAYGVRVGFTRQMLVNDSLGAIAQVLGDRANAVSRFEDRTFYAMAFSGAGGDGPTLMETSRQVFNTTDKTKASSGTAIDIAALSAGRKALRTRKTVDGAEMELTASLIVVGPAKETEAQQLLAPIQAQQAGNVNPFSGTLQILVTAKIDDNRWFMFASPDEAAVFEWGLLEGYSAPRMRWDQPFGVQGVSMSLEHDFGCGAIDWRGAWKNPGN